MPNPSPEIIQLLATFAPAMTAPTFANALVLIYGTILAPGRRSRSAALRVLGLGHDATFGKYHRVLSRARWSPMVLSRMLLSLILRLLVPEHAPIMLLIDETLERRRGKQIAYTGWLRDAMRSTAKHVAITLGIRWCCMSVLVHVPWSQRPWALPFLIVPVLSEKTCQQLGKRHCGTVGWAMRLITQVRRWHPQRDMVLVGDGAYASVTLVQTCQRFQKPVTLVTRLRLDAGLYDVVGPQPAGKRGPTPKKGKKGAPQPKLTERLIDPTTAWQCLTVPGYGGQHKMLAVLTGVSLWYTQGVDPVPMRWVVVRCPEDEQFQPAAYLCSDPNMTAEQILGWFVSRWNIEVTFEELRAHLGFETQRQWSTRAIERTTPCLFGLFSLVVLVAKVLHPETLPVAQRRWYPKEEATFSDALAAVRWQLWGEFHCTASSLETDLCLIPRPLLQRLQNVACYAA
jgi:DDE superfamily endonuclease